MRLALGVVALVLLLTGCGGQQQMATMYLPAVPVSGYQWPEQGFGHPPESWEISHAALTDGRQAWYYDWWWDCARWAGDPAYVPSVMRAWYPQVLACNDGRPLLVLNEPEDPAQAGLTPEQAAAVLYQAALAWRGEIWCCGTQVQHLPYMRRLVDAYEAAYGAWPATGLHVHVYGHRAGRTQNANTVADAQAALASLDEFVTWAQSRGVIGRGVVVSECCVLSDVPPSVETLAVYEGMMDAVDVVLSVAWFSVGYQPWPGSDLLDGVGGPTGVGVWWLDGATR